MTKVHLLDVNLLIALVDPVHLDHGRAHAWFGWTGRKAYATCPITENGLLRIVGHPRYANSPGPPSVVLESLRAIRALPGHQFWPDDVSLVDERLVDGMTMPSHASVTDLYLLTLAVAHQGRLATLDQRLRPDAVAGGREALVLV